MKNRNFEKILPEKYVQIKHIDATNVKLGVILNVIAGVVISAFIAAAMFILGATDKLPLDFKPLPLILGALGTFAYIALHELTHGA
ncbi:MAG: hypothetical protein J6R40_01690, partial [Clostridia bacterium]|nr:hypothetical protein [Clostridia bacterium]